MTAALSLGALSGCSEYEGPTPSLDEIRYPVGLAVHPNGRYLYVTNSNFDVSFRERDGGSVVVLDAETLTPVSSSGVRIGSFAGGVALSAAADPSHLYVAVRGDQSLVALSLADDGRTVRCEGREDGLPCRILDLPGDPFSVASIPLSADSPETTELVAVAGLGGALSYVTLDWSAGPSALGESSVRSELTSGGASAVRYLPTSGETWVTGRFSQGVRGVTPVFDPAAPESGVVVEAAVTSLALLPVHAVNRSGVSLAESRDIAFSGDLGTAYVSTRTPGAIFVVDMTLDDDGLPRADVLRRIDVDGGAGELVVAREGDRDVLYVSLSSDEALGVFDATSGVKLATIALDGDPYGLALDSERHALFVGMFAAHAVSRVDLDPTSPTFRTVTRSSP
ncbi:MAG: hypothetical protein H6698_04630 [Myxococcales bacterium]|nr:hypothetical protein [Myxococcales bacterium]MCB9519607.1 hypothetical protein [Myxococcales bacterium]MCB9530666.1 hypothetical protein [Myxococcales bacterium]MCB9533587.1 hypothetical protein [Myxococcales bacterium]